MCKINDLMARGTELLGSDYAILCGAMSWVSERHLVSAISNAGGFGVIACGAMTPELLDAEIAGTKALATRNFGVNLITMHPQLFELIDVCAKHGVGHVVLAGGLPPKGSLEAIKASGAKVICFAPTLALAKKLVRSGVDALVIEGMEAGGHIGPVSTPERTSFLASARVGAKQMTFAPDALIASRLPLGGRPPASTTWPTRCFAHTSIRSNNCGCIVIRLTPKLRVASALVPAISASSNAGVIAPHAITPNPPALLMALTRWRSETQLIAPHRMA